MWRIKKYLNTGDCSNYCTPHVPSPPSRLTYTIILETNVSYVSYIMSLTACLALFRSFFALDLDIAQNLIVTAYAHIKIPFCHYYDVHASTRYAHAHCTCWATRSMDLAKSIQAARWLSSTTRYTANHRKGQFSLENIACSSFINNLSGIVWLDCVWLTRGGVILNVKGSGKEIMT